jgi:hypothetical protein
VTGALEEGQQRVPPELRPLYDGAMGIETDNVEHVLT